jgi:hypothetical protein
VDGTRRLINRGLVLSRMVGSSGPYCEPGPLNDNCGYEVAVHMVLDSRGQGHYHDDHKQFDTTRRLRRDASGAWVRIGGQTRQSAMFCCIRS